jgi:hypothetical protein
MRYYGANAARYLKVLPYGSKGKHMKTNATGLIIAAGLVLAILGLFFQPGRTAAQVAGGWQVVAGSGDGIAWKINTQSGELIYCFRVNCFHPIMNASIPR